MVDHTAFCNFPPANLLAGKVMVITGAGQGMGKVLAQVAVREGARVLVADLSGMEEETAAALGANAVPFHLDVTQESQVEAMFKTAIDHFGKVDASVHLAGISGGRRGDEVTFAEYEEHSRVHLGGMMMCTKHAIRAMAPGGGGAIVNFSSVGSLNGIAFISAAYAAAKAGVNAMTKSFAVHAGEKNIRVNAIAPGFTLSEKNLDAPAPLAMSSRAALGRAANAEEPVQLAVFLCSDRAAFISGVVIPVDGGWSARLA
jgi:NAD(P)-dependent dehydrogenase (short-subunit alcohol dehydrogenase family)